MAFSDVAVSDPTAATARPLSGINITPLVDVLLVLLIIFMVTAPMLSRPVSVSLPQISDRVVEVKPRVLDLAVAADGSLRLDDRPMSQAQVLRQLDEAATADARTQLRIRADASAEYQQLVSATALARRSGIASISLAD